jgi:hypothetical protein
MPEPTSPRPLQFEFTAAFGLQPYTFPHLLGSEAVTGSARLWQIHKKGHSVNSVSDQILRGCILGDQFCYANGP